VIANWRVAHAFEGGAGTVLVGVAVGVLVPPEAEEAADVVGAVVLSEGAGSEELVVRVGLVLGVDDGALVHPAIAASRTPHTASRQTARIT
jgi:hypothetical protein